MNSPTGRSIMAKKETFNQLDEKFQVLDHHDPEIIFPEEYEMIKDMRAQRPELVFFVTFANMHFC